MLSRHSSVPEFISAFSLLPPDALTLDAPLVWEINSLFEANEPALILYGLLLSHLAANQRSTCQYSRRFLNRLLRASGNLIPMTDETWTQINLFINDRDFSVTSRFYRVGDHYYPRTITLVQPRSLARLTEFCGASLNLKDRDNEFITSLAIPPREIIPRFSRLNLVSSRSK